MSSFFDSLVHDADGCTVATDIQDGNSSDPHSKSFDESSDGDGSNPSSELSFDSEDATLDTYKDESIAEIALGNARSIIDQLYRLSFKIRNPATRLGFSGANKHRKVDIETGIDLFDQFAVVDKRNVEEVVADYRNTSPEDCNDDFLVKRLAKANTYRRRQFSHWRKHQAKMARADQVNAAHQTRDQPQQTRSMPFRSSEFLALNDATGLTAAPSMPSTA